MGAPQPQFIPEAFALAAAGPNRNVIPLAPVTTQRASFQLGFPPLTMTPIIAGGKPMLGPDMNGILYMMSSHTFYQQSGQPYRFNAAVAAALTGAGYAAGTLLGSTDGVTLWFNLVNNNATDPDDDGAAAGWVALYSYGISNLPPSVGGVLTLTPSQAARPVIVISGVLAANLQVVLPPTLQRWLVVNSTTGAFTTTVKTAGGSGVQVPQGGFSGPTEVYGDGTNIYPVVAPITLPTDVAPTPNTIALRSNNGYLFAAYFNQSSSVENFTISEVYAGAGDGYLRKITKPNFAANFLLSQFAGQVTTGQVPQAAVTQFTAAILANAALTGTPTTPTAPAGTNTTQVASTAFARGSSSLGVTGHATFPNGITIQWGTSVVGASTLVAFPISFPSACWGVLFSVIGSTNQVNRGALTASNVTLLNGGGASVFWFAVGA